MFWNLHVNFLSIAAYVRSWPWSGISIPDFLCTGSGDLLSLGFYIRWRVYFRALGIQRSKDVFMASSDGICMMHCASAGLTSRSIQRYMFACTAACASGEQCRDYNCRSFNIDTGTSKDASDWSDWMCTVKHAGVYMSRLTISHVCSCWQKNWQLLVWVSKMNIFDVC